MSANLELFRRIILANELGGDRHLAYEFSDPDGVRTGKSGWSFGVCQFDIGNNRTALDALQACSFTDGEIVQLQQQLQVDMRPLNARLLSQKSVVDHWDSVQLDECLSWVTTLCQESKIKLKSLTVLLHLADYHNQFYMSKGGKLHSWLKSLRTPVSPEMIRDFKLNRLSWGKTRPQDVQRRYANILKITGGFPT